MEDIETLADLVRAFSYTLTGGYDASEFTILPNQHSARASETEFFLIVVVKFTEPELVFQSGEYWFWSDNTVMQVL